MVNVPEDLEETTVEQVPVEELLRRPLGERIAALTAQAAAAEERIRALEAALATSEMMRSNAEMALDTLQGDATRPRWLSAADPDPGDDVVALVSAEGAGLWYRLDYDSGKWARLSAETTNTTVYTWADLQDEGPFVGIRDDWLLSILVRDLRRSGEMYEGLWREMWDEPERRGYRAPSEMPVVIRQVLVRLRTEAAASKDLAQRAKFECERWAKVAEPSEGALSGAVDAYRKERHHGSSVDDAVVAAVRYLLRAYSVGVAS